MFVDPVAEFVGLILTPAAIGGCILLLQSRRPSGNPIAFAPAFLALYAAISILVLAIGDFVEPTDDTSTTKGVVSLVIGWSFLLRTRPAIEVPVGCAALSGLGIVVADAITRGDQVAGTAFLLSGGALDVVVPIVAFAVLGARARTGLDRAKQWLVTHDRLMTIVILFGFGLFFAGRGPRAVL